MEQKVDAVIASAKAMRKGKPDFQLAARKLKNLRKGETYRALAGHVAAFCEKWWYKFLRTGNVEEEHKSGRPYKVPDAVALEAAQLLAEGTWFSFIKKKQRWWEKRGFSTIRDAVRELQRLQEIKQQYGVDDDGLLRAMQRVAPRLKRKTIFFKRKFTDEELVARMQLAAWLVQSLPADEAQRVAWLGRLVFIDEGGVSLADYKKESVKAWCMDHDPNIHSMVHAPWMKGQKECKVHFIIAVTSHHKFATRNGLVHWEFTTGTTDIRRRWNTLGQTEHEPFGYTVSHSACVNTMLPQASARMQQQYCRCCCNKITRSQPILL